MGPDTLPSEVPLTSATSSVSQGPHAGRVRDLFIRHSVVSVHSAQAEVPSG